MWDPMMQMFKSVLITEVLSALKASSTSWTREVSLWLMAFEKALKPHTAPQAPQKVSLACWEVLTTLQQSF